MNPRNENDEAVQMWRSAFALASVVAAASLLAIWGALAKGIPIAPIWITVLILMLLCLGVLLRLRDRLAMEKVFTFLFAVETSMALIATALSQNILAYSGKPFAVFGGLKLIAFSIALIGPPKRWMGLSCLAAAALVAVSQYYSWPASLRAGLAVQEPWLTLIFMIASALLYFFRLSWRELERNAARLQSRTQMLQHFADLLVDAQHLLNTPLQTIENTTAIIKHQHPEVRDSLEPLEQCLSRVREIMTLLSRCDSHASWPDVELPESIEEFERRLKNLMQD